jgi:catechol 2,3-dioxygenase-like lactoylglutathione lyase family enzyme
MTEIRGGSFQTLVARSDTHVVLDLDTPAETLLILFGGIAGGVSMPVFEFFRLTSDLPAMKAFLRDPRRAWYQLGIPGIGESASDVKAFLDAVIARSQAQRVVTTGASAGGFAALLFGAWCAVDEVVAFSPQTFIDPGNRAAFGDERWPDQIEQLHTAVGSSAATFDIRNALPSFSGKTRFQIHVSTDDPLDIQHAHRVADKGGVEIVEHVDGGHRLVKSLRDRGLLRPMLLDALTGARGGLGRTESLPDPKVTSYT